ncbi:hypothetical protein [Selenomonas ruminantium]|nr:hypothetical protein [Selenomonas ruminantium]
MKFDFCVIDTYHHHPVEVLNFISVLPFLKNGSIVVMHDTTVFEWFTEYTFLKMLSPRLLLSAVCAPKYIPDLPSGNMVASNIAAWQINSDTRKYIQNVFDVLYVPWETDVSDDVICNVRQLVDKTYENKYLKMFDEAVLINKKLCGARRYVKTGITSQFKFIEPNSIYYGAGNHMGRFLNVVHELGINFEFTIWDIEASKIDVLCGHKVLYPDFYTKVSDNRKMIVMIENQQVYETVEKKFKTLGYCVIKGVE